MRSQSGFSMLEIVVSLAVSAVISLGVGTSINQIYRITEQNNNWSAADRQAQFAGDWISHDMLMASYIDGQNPLVPGEDGIRVVWNEWGTAQEYSHNVTYMLTPTDDGLNDLERTYSAIDTSGDPVPGSGGSTIVATNISGIGILRSGSLWYLNVYTRSGSSEASRTYEINPRLNFDY